MYGAFSILGYYPHFFNRCLTVLPGKETTVEAVIPGKAGKPGFVHCTAAQVLSRHTIRGALQKTANDAIARKTESLRFPEALDDSSVHHVPEKPRTGVFISPLSCRPSGVRAVAADGISFFLTMDRNRPLPWQRT